MKVPTPEGEKDALAIEFRMEDIEHSVRIVLSDGTVLVTRSTVCGVFAFDYDDGRKGYYVQHNHAITRIGH